MIYKCQKFPLTFSASKRYCTARKVSVYVLISRSPPKILYVAAPLRLNPPKNIGPLFDPKH
jgi:hypothetical protein